LKAKQNIQKTACELLSEDENIALEKGDRNTELKPKVGTKEVSLKRKSPVSRD